MLRQRESLLQQGPRRAHRECVGRQQRVRQAGAVGAQEYWRRGAAGGGDQRGGAGGGGRDVWGRGGWEGGKVAGES